VLFIASCLVIVILLPLLLHAAGAITLGFLTGEPTYTYEQRPLNVATERALETLQEAVAAHRYVSASKVVEGLEATARRLLDQRRAGHAEVNQLIAGLDGLRAEIGARRALRAGAPRLAYETLRRHADERIYPKPIRERIATLLATAIQAAEDAEPVVQGLEFARVAAGVYRVGTPPGEAERRDRTDSSGGLADGEVRAVRVAEFWISTTEVPRAVYTRQLQLEQPAWRAQNTAAAMPASHVGFEDAQAFCGALTERSRLYVFALPTESEWEIACRAGRDPGDGPFAVDADDQQKVDRAKTSAGWANVQDSVLRTLERYMVFSANCRAVLRDAKLRDPPVPIGLRKPNPIGLLDMHGGVAEWCRPDEGTRSAAVVVRGGHCVSDYREVRAGARRRADPDRTALYGFRITARRK
jgi:formylglycine-generating enzyme required for sulfatase activity